jgi:copper(I)-binding protein
VRLRAPGARRAGLLTMRTVPDIPIPANSWTRLNPDSYHLLITGAGAMQDGKDITLRLTFANAGTVTILAMVTDPQVGRSSSYFFN